MTPNSGLEQFRSSEQSSNQACVIASYSLAGDEYRLFPGSTCGCDEEFRREDAFGRSVPASRNWFRKYDSRGKVIEEGLYWDESVLIFRWVYFYNSRGNKTQANLYNAQHSLLERRQYDEDEKLVKRLIYKDDNCDEQVECVYDETMTLVGSNVTLPNLDPVISRDLRVLG